MLIAAAWAGDRTRGECQLLQSVSQCVFVRGPTNQNEFEDDGNFMAQFLDGGGKGGGKGPARAGDWICPKCKANVFANKSKCFKCQTEKPADTKPEAKEAEAPASDALSRRMQLESSKRAAVDSATPARRAPTIAAPMPLLAPTTVEPEIDINQLAAKAKRAKLMGKHDLHDELMKQVEAAKLAAAKQSATVVMAQVSRRRHRCK